MTQHFPSFLLGLLLISQISLAQVTIGENEPPVNGALLQLKNKTNSNNITNADKGLQLPRVSLLSRTLEGTYDNLSKTISNATGTWDKNQHEGLMVYNISESGKDICPGIYVWNGDEWVKIGNDCTNMFFDLSSKDKLSFLSGLNGSTITPQHLTATWSPETGTLNSTNTANTPFSALTFTTNPLPAELTGGNSVISINPDIMSPSDITSNPYATKESLITFKVSDKGKELSHSIIVNQTNKAIKVNDKTTVILNNILSTSSAGVKNAIIESNAKWKITVTPSTNSSISSLSKNSGGSEREDGNANAKETISYNVAYNMSKSRYSYIIFGDENIPKRFSDVVIIYAQCGGTTDITMNEYKNLWEQIYGLDPTIDEPNSNGNTTKNKNLVQWHYDQNNNIFFSGMFGTAGRWMINNLAATTFAPNSPTKPTMALRSTYLYPGGGASNATYLGRERIGLLYSGSGALGGQNTANVDQKGIAHTPIQGICPDGWHLPTEFEWSQFINVIQTTPSKWSTNTNNQAAVTVKDSCEPIIGMGKSFSILDGGFSVMLAGRDGSLLGTNTYFWSSSANFSGSAWYYSFGEDLNSFTTGAGSYSNFYSVRCKKN